MAKKLKDYQLDKFEKDDSPRRKPIKKPKREDYSPIKRKDKVSQSRNTNNKI